MWVAQLGGDVELEVLGVFDGGVSQLDAETATLLERLLQQQRLQDGVQLLSDVLQQHLKGQEQTFVLCFVQVQVDTNSHNTFRKVF